MAIRQLNIEGRTYYFYNDLTNIKNFNSNNPKLGKKRVLGNDVYYNGYITKKLQGNVNSVNPLHLMINRMKGHFEKVDGDKYLIISSENSDIMQKCQEFFDGIKEKINDYSYPIKYDDNYRKIKFKTNDNILLNKIIYFPTITITIRSVTEKDGTYHPQLFLDDCLHEV